MSRIAINGPFSSVTFAKQTLACMLLGILVLAQALGVIYIKQYKRVLHANLQHLGSVRDKLQIEWSQLLLEQGTWETDARVERIARDRLDMIIPEKVNVIIL